MKVELKFDTKKAHGETNLVINDQEVEFSRLTLFIDDKFPEFFVEPPKSKQSNVKTSKSGAVTTISSKELEIGRE